MDVKIPVFIARNQRILPVTKAVLLYVQSLNEVQRNNLTPADIKGGTGICHSVWRKVAADLGRLGLIEKPNAKQFECLEWKGFNYGK